MAIRSSNSERAYERHVWSSDNSVVQLWVSDLVWKILCGPYPSIETPKTEHLPREALDALSAVLLENRLEGMALLVYGPKLRPILGASVYDKLESAKRRTELFLQEIHWLLAPMVGEHALLIEDYAIRGYYAHMAAVEGAFNPRFIDTLAIWTPTLAAREEVIKLLFQGGYERDASLVDAHVFTKVTAGILHRIWLRGTLWEASKNWALDLEREIWERAVLYSSSTLLRPEVTDLYLMTIRRFAIDALMGSASVMLDIVTLLEQAADSIDWDRVRKIKNAFHKPEWIWAGFLAAQMFEHKSGRKFDLPEWAREWLRSPPDNFLVDFLASRVNWANPDARLIDFPRAYVKLARGT